MQARINGCNAALGPTVLVRNLWEINRKHVKSCACPGPNFGYNTWARTRFT